MDKKDKNNIAAALKYNSKENIAPQLIAFGEKYSAQKIIETAKENNIPIYENSALAESLGKINIGQEIPKELYEVVAQVLLFVAQLDEQKGKRGR